MSNEDFKIKHSKRMQQKTNHIKKQYKIAKNYGHVTYLKQPHRLAKLRAMDCGQPECVLCGNPRRTFEQPTIQEKRFNQKEIHVEQELMDYIITFLALFVTDVINTLYIKAINKEQPLRASFWAMVVTLAASVAVINYTRDNTMLIPALLGAFVGTYVGMKLKHKNET